MSIKIKSVDSNFEREPLLRPFGFKGGYMTEIWQTIASLGQDHRHGCLGMCSQNVLWSDAAVFAKYSQTGGNALMYTVTEYALSLVRGTEFDTPIELLEKIFDPVFKYAKAITAHQHLRETFVLNALVGLDNAAWLLYARENDIHSFDEMVPDAFRPALSTRHNKISSIPLISYAIPVDEIKRIVDQGYFFMKIKIGQPGTQEEMLEKDKLRLTEIHRAIGNVETPYTANGKLPYYFDANGRYQNKDMLYKLLDHAQSIGAYDQIVLIEEPFPEEYEGDVSDFNVRIASDESIHTEADVIKRIQMGYTAIALKPIAKTLSMTLKMLNVAYRNKVPCFCADLTVNPILVEWNKNVAARLAPFPGLETGLLETNGHQNYKNWDTMVSYHPYKNASWRHCKKGLFHLDKDFYAKSGGIFKSPDHYHELVE